MWLGMVKGGDHNKDRPYDKVWIAFSLYVSVNMQLGL
jgi:hypothetical protein